MTTSREFPSKAGPITHVRLVNSSGASVVLSSMGVGIVEVTVPDQKG